MRAAGERERTCPTLDHLAGQATEPDNIADEGFICALLEHDRARIGNIARNRARIANQCSGPYNCISPVSVLSGQFQCSIAKLLKAARPRYRAVQGKFAICENIDACRIVKGDRTARGKTGRRSQRSSVKNHRP